MRNAHPPESPLNGGMNLTIPLLGGMPFFGGEGATFKIWLSQGIIFKIQVNFF
jgi:hypothetical protein